MTSILYCAVTTEKYHETRVRAVLETWGADVGSQLYFFSDAAGASDRIINLKVPSDYKSASLKLVTGIRWIAKHHSVPFDWIMICDDDTFVFTKNLAQFLAKEDPQVPVCYGQQLNHYPPLPDLLYPSGGAGYVFSRAAFERLLPSLEGATMYDYNDVTIGVCMKATGIALHDTRGFYSQNPETTAKEHEKRGDTPVRSPFSFHYISPERMHQLYAVRIAF